MKHLSGAVIASAAILGTLLACGMGAARADDPVPQTEESDILTLSDWTPHRILVQDTVGHHAKDGRVYVVDGDRGKLLGMVQEAYNGNVVLDPKGRAFYIGETVWARGNRGDRADLLPTYDPHTLAIVNDLKLPGRALITPKKNDLAINADGSLVYVFDMVPSNAVHVIDTATHTLRQSVGVPGCALVYPWGKAGFTTICGDGGLASVTLGQGAPQITHTPAFFDPDKDAVFEHSPSNRATGQIAFISYSGLVYPSVLSAHPQIGKPWSLQEAAGQPKAPDAAQPFAVAWRPGGWQLAAWHYASNHLFVVMHRGTFWTHKQDGEEVWELDYATHKLLRRIKLPKPTSLVGVTQDAHPLLFTDDREGDLFVFDAQSGKLVHTMPHLGDDLYFTVALGE